MASRPSIASRMEQEQAGIGGELPGERRGVTGGKRVVEGVERGANLRLGHGITGRTVTVR